MDINIKYADFFGNQLGAFFELRGEAGEVEKHHQIQLQSEKFVIDLFMKTLFDLHYLESISNSFVKC